MYQGEFVEDLLPEEIDGERVEEYALVLVRGAMEEQERLDRLIDENSRNWSVSRMPLVDRAILRIALYEMIYQDDVPLGVSIDEAVELAKSFGGEDESSRFVNGVLGAIATLIESGELDKEQEEGQE